MCSRAPVWSCGSGRGRARSAGRSPMARSRSPNRPVPARGGLGPVMHCRGRQGPWRWYSAGPWALVSAGTFEDDVQAVNRARRQRPPPRLIFSVAAGVREFAGEVDDPEGIYGASQWYPGSATRTELGPPQDAFLAAYAATTCQPADYPGVQAAAAAVIAPHCARRARSTARGQLWAQAAALDTATLFGRFRIDPVTGAQVKHEAVLVRWLSGGLALAGGPRPT